MLAAEKWHKDSWDLHESSSKHTDSSQRHLCLAGDLFISSSAFISSTGPFCSTCKKIFFCDLQLCASKTGISLSVARGVLSSFWRQRKALPLCGAWNQQELWGESAKMQRHTAVPGAALGWLLHANSVCGLRYQICAVLRRDSSAARTMRGRETHEKQELLLGSAWPQRTAQYRMWNSKGIRLKGK